MKLKSAIGNFIEKTTGYTIQKKSGNFYNEDGLRTIHNHEFINDPLFEKAYSRGIEAAKDDYHFRWRVHVALWIAYNASKLDGDFVECGVNRGFISSAIMNYLNWNSFNKHFYLLDTFKGLDERVVSQDEISTGALEKNKELLESGFYVSGVKSVEANFSEWKNVHIIEGTIPDTLPEVTSS